MPRRRRVRKVVRRRIVGRGAYKVLKTIGEKAGQHAVKRRRQGRSFFDAGGQLARTVGATLGEAAGPAGIVAGMAAGHIFHKITGWGDYHIKHNTLSKGNPIASFTSTGTGVEICHREFLTDIVGSVGFNLTSYPIQPGLATFAPWLASIAENFEEYIMEGLVFEYRPSSGSAISTNSSSLGVVVFATNYNVLDPNFQNKQQAESYEFSNSTVPFNPMMHMVECAPRSNITNTLFTRNGPVPNSDSQQLYDLGNFQVITQGMQSAYTVGELWVTYHVKFLRPRISPNTDNVYSHIVSLPLNTATALNSAYLGTTGGSITSDSNLPYVTIPSGTAATSSILLTNPGNYMVNLSYSTISAGTMTSPPQMLYGANISNLTMNPLSIMRGNTTNFNQLFVSTLGVDNAYINCSLYGTGSANLITFTQGTGYVQGNTDIFIFPLPTAVN